MTFTAAIDVGTTTARAGLFADDGTRVAIARRRLSRSSPFDGAVEQDPDEFVSASVELLAEAVAAAGASPADVSALGITNQRATVVAWDATTGQALRPAIGWQDTRTAGVVAELVAQGLPLNTSASCTKLQWLVDADPAVRAAAAKGTLRLGTVDTWLTWALSGGAVHVTDPSNAGATGLYDARTGDWSGAALDLFGVPHEPMAEVAASDAVVGTTAPELVGAAIPLGARLGDQMAACAAHGMVAGMAKLTLGTSAMLDVGVGSSPVPPPSGCYTLPLWRRTVDGIEREEHLIEGSVNTAGSVVEWLVEVGLLEAVERLDEVAARGRVGSGLGTGVTFVPSLAGSGSPHNDPQARGVVSGISLDTTAADVVRAALEGIAGRVAELVTHMAVAGDLRVDGGLSRSRVLREAIENRTGLRVIGDDPDATLAGAALLASR